ncbi:MAG: polysaccharide biosynthesis tyrosine autokinase [Gemmataceae bacterium]|nr:polysaccharide biosynthesis tyrosine autokinase [Gemmataceae bacterium]
MELSTSRPTETGGSPTATTQRVSAARAVTAPERAHRGSGAEPPSVLSTIPNLPGLLQAARRRWRISLALGMMAAGAAAAAVWFTQTEQFIARTLVHIAVNRPILIADTPDGRSDFNSYQRTQSAYVRSRLVLNAALRDPKVAGLQTLRGHLDPLGWLEERINVDFSVAPEIMRIAMTGEHPQELTAIVNAVREAYFKEVRRLEIDGRQKRLNKLSEIYAEVDQKLQDKRRMLNNLAEDLGSTKDTKVMLHTQEMYWKNLENLENELLQTRSKLLRTRMELDIQKGRDPKAALSPKEIEEHVSKDKEVLSYERQIAELDSNLESLGQTARDPESEPAYKRMTAAREAAAKSMQARKEELRASLSKTVRESGANKAKDLKSEIVIWEEQERWLADELDARLKSFKGLNKSRIDMEWLRDEIGLHDDLAKRMAGQRQLLQIEMQAPERFNLLEEAVAVPDKDTRIKRAGMAGGGAFGLVILLIAFVEFRSRRVNNVDEIVRGLNLRLVGAIPAVPQRVRNQTGESPSNSKDVRWQSQLTESVASARTMLLHAAQAEGVKLIVVTSAVGAEGKTLTCSHLAASLARAGRRTLLIDADLRRPALQKLFNLPSQPGFSELLRGEVDLDAAIRATQVQGLSVMTAGNSDNRAVQALAQPILGETFRRLKEQYDFVIVDSAPILLVADSQVICQESDGVLFSVLKEVSRLPQIYAAYERLTALRARILGAVVNGADGPVSSSSYPYARNS